MLDSLRQNNRATEAEAFQDFEPAVERTSWVKAGSCRVNFGSGRWESATLELEQSGTTNGGATGLDSQTPQKRSKLHFSTLESAQKLSFPASKNFLQDVRNWKNIFSDPPF